MDFVKKANWYARKPGREKTRTLAVLAVEEQKVYNL